MTAAPAGGRTRRLRPDARLRVAVVPGGLHRLAGSRPDDPAGNTGTQAADGPRRIDAPPAKAGTDRSQLLSALPFLPDLDHGAATNRVRNARRDPAHGPARVGVRARPAARRTQTSGIAALP